MREARYGSWKSPITASMITASGVSLSQIQCDGPAVSWVENRPLEEGRAVIVRWEEGEARDLLPREFNARSRVHEYGGGAYLASGGGLFFSNFEDGRLYHLAPGRPPVPITPEPPSPAALRYGDLCLSADHRWLVCVRECHREGQVVNDLALVPPDGSRPPVSLASGNDFYSFPRLSPDGGWLAWTAWDHPRMPWDGTELWLACFRGDGSLAGARRVAGGPEESIFQPEWSPDGRLHFISDRTGWWNLYALDGDRVVPLAPREAEFGAPQWVFGLSRYAFLPGGALVASFTEGGVDRLGVLRPGRREIEVLETPYTAHPGGGYVEAGAGGWVYLLAGSPSRSVAVVRVNVESGEDQVLRESVETRVDAGYLSEARPIEFPGAGGRKAFAFYYPPRNRDFRGPPPERPPLLVLTHGGPTSATTPELRLGIQYWTSRGLAVVDVNYGGSTGYGRAYRESLKGAWGVTDCLDCIAAARHLVARGEVDGRRLAIRGGSAGGYTTLCALVFHDTFAAGASYYGVADLEALARDTHKFESRYLDGLVGPYPEAARLYRERSPIHFTDRLSCPVAVFQGLEDRVVPPSQAEALVEALRRKGLPYMYIPLAGEQHGFRVARNIERCLEAEFAFYARVFGFEPADPLSGERIENL